MLDSQSNELLIWIILLPFIGFLVNGVLMPITHRGLAKTRVVSSGSIATLLIFTSFILSVISFGSLSDLGDGTYLSATPYTWFEVGALQIQFSVRLDRLNSVLVLIITGVGTLIHLYSMGYMSHEKGPARYFAYLNLFCAAMLLLVMGNNLVLLFFGWEGVGLCSYLLIGYWYTDIEKARAGRKAFIINRIGDLGFLIGIFLIYYKFGSLDFSTLKMTLTSAAGSLDPTLMSWIGIFLFIGATGKSAQIPLFVWLPDAMAGPTPVSALIHAATMVTAGVYMIARLYFLFDLAPDALSVIAHVGAFTALLAGSIALFQNDIKKVLAYSTVSQLGLMFLAAGVGAYTTAIFHLMTHAFFKALLFLGAGSVIHGCQGEQDMQKMGGLKAKMPITFWTMAVGAGAISGVPLLSGFFSKDEILFSTLVSEHGSPHLYFMGLATAFLTAWYISRMMVLTFFHEYRGQDSHHLHESPPVMLVPLVLLAALAAFGGFLGFPHLLGEPLGFHHALSHWLAPAVRVMEVPSMGIQLPIHELVGMLIATATAALGIFLGWKLSRSPEGVQNPAQVLLRNKYYIDEFYGAVIVRPLQVLAQGLYRFADVAIIDRLIMQSSFLPRRLATQIRGFQNGDIQRFAVVIGMGLALLAGVLWFQTHS